MQVGPKPNERWMTAKSDWRRFDTTLTSIVRAVIFPPMKLCSFVRTCRDLEGNSVALVLESAVSRSSFRRLSSMWLIPSIKRLFMPTSGQRDPHMPPWKQWSQILATAPAPCEIRCVRGYLWKGIIQCLGPLCVPLSRCREYISIRFEHGNILLLSFLVFNFSCEVSFYFTRLRLAKIECHQSSETTFQN